MKSEYEILLVLHLLSDFWTVSLFSLDNSFKKKMKNL